jgi:hypothetical protein
LSVIGASLLWVGWFGFNAGSAVTAGYNAGMAAAATQIATCRCGAVLDVRRMDRRQEAFRPGHDLRAPSRAWWPSPRRPASSIRWVR